MKEQQEIKIEEIPNDVVETVFGFCKAFNEAQEKNKTSLTSKHPCCFKFSFEKWTFVCTKTQRENTVDEKICIIDITEEDSEDVSDETIEQVELVELNNNNKGNKKRNRW